VSIVNVVTLDGPSGAGKGTLGVSIANKLSYNYLDSGVFYRALAVAAERHNVDLNDKEGLKKLANNLDIFFQVEFASIIKLFLEGEDVTRELMLESTASRASILALDFGVRAALTARQRLFAISPGLVADGRDMGTVVFPNATLKFFLTANIETRARRRYKQLLLRGDNVSLPAIWRQLEERDERDTKRSISPLVPAKDAIKLDTTNMVAGEVVEAVMNILVDRGFF
tara:strand:- start:35434 stop:36114 length:681 start_codon:yes stop_codon:yes gene_type:complete